jgi:Uma2 family endonuclease
MLKALRKRARTIGPEDNGRRMTLDAFDRATGREGYVYELSKGVVEVTDVPHPDHAKQVQAIRNQITLYQEANPGAIELVAGSNESKILLAAEASERHPDLSLYLTPTPPVPDVWSVWVPSIVIEVVSPSSWKRDYEEKPDEYLSFGVDEYWIVDAGKGQLTANTRWRGQWKPKVVKPPQKYATGLLPGFSLDLKRVLAASGAPRK